MRPPTWHGPAYRGAMRDRRARRRAEAAERQTREQAREAWREQQRAAEYERAQALQIASGR